ncbi:MAG TPA: NifU family protein [Planctomycetota bacterium]|nr:NifU family protein [Planctomycetota bacterium]
MNNPPLQITPEDTPNPNSNRFALNRTILNGPGVDFPNPSSARVSPLARELFMLPGVRGVYIGPNFVTVSAEAPNWWTLRPLVSETIQIFIASGKPVVEDGGAQQQESAPAPKYSEIEAGIVQLLETEIQPAVAMDGGFIAFAGYDKGIVKLQLRGACHSCPSSMVTLKVGIENRLKQQFPEIQGVEAV